MSVDERMETELAERFAEWSAPGEAEAEERVRRLTAADFAARPQSRRRLPRRSGLAAAIAALVAGFALTPAGAKVSDLVSDAVSGGQEATPVKLGGFPHVGPLLVDAGGKTWLVEPDGSKRELGRFSDAAFSPHGLYVAATEGDRLSAIDLEGEERWSSEGTYPVMDPTWSQSGFRIAYREGDTVRVIAGDGTGDTEIADKVFAPPAWRPASPTLLRSSTDGAGTHELTYAELGGLVRLVDTDSGEVIWTTRVPTNAAANSATIRDLSWSTNGARLLVEMNDGYAVFRRDGSLVTSVRGSRLGDVEISPDGSRVAFVAPRGKNRTVFTEGAKAGGQPIAKVFSGPGPITDLDWSAHGRTLAIGWKAADQWVFIRPGARATGVSEIGRQFDGAGGSFPRIVDWCCRAPGS